MSSKLDDTKGLLMANKMIVEQYVEKERALEVEMQALVRDKMIVEHVERNCALEVEVQTLRDKLNRIESNQKISDKSTENDTNTELAVNQPAAEVEMQTLRDFAEGKATESPRSAAEKKSEEVKTQKQLDNAKDRPGRGK